MRLSSKSIADLEEPSSSMHFTALSLRSLALCLICLPSSVHSNFVIAISISPPLQLPFSLKPYLPHLLDVPHVYHLVGKLGPAHHRNTLANALQSRVPSIVSPKATNGMVSKNFLLWGPGHDHSPTMCRLLEAFRKAHLV